MEVVVPLPIVSDVVVCARSSKNGNINAAKKRIF
jgi:hypothetical protein